MTMKRRQFLTAAAATAVPAAAIAAPIIDQEPEGKWEPTSRLKLARHSNGAGIQQMFVNAKTGEEEWRFLGWEG